VALDLLTASRPEPCDWAQAKQILDKREQGFGMAIVEGRAIVQVNPRFPTARLATGIGPATGRQARRGGRA